MLALSCRALLLLVALLLFAEAAHGQAVRVDQIALGPRGIAIANPTVTVCTSSGSGTPCTPLASGQIFSNSTLTTQCSSNPLPTIAIGNVSTGCGVDALGNFGFWTAPGSHYKVSITGPGVQTPILLDVPVACDATQACTHSGSDTFAQPIVSTVGTGTAPFSIASTTQVVNLNAQLHGGLAAPASAIVGVSDTQTLTNKSLITTSSGDSVTSLNAQASGSAVVGTGSAVTLYTYSLPGSTVANLKGFRVNVGWIHNTGSAVVTYNLQLNGVNVAHILNSAFSGNGAWVTATVLNTGSTTGTVVWSLLDFSLNQVSAGQATTLTGLAWSSSQVLQFTFSVANTDQVTPVFWNVELIQ